MSASNDNRPAVTKAEVADLRAALKASLTASPCSSHPPLPKKVLADSTRCGAWQSKAFPLNSSCGLPPAGPAGQAPTRQPRRRVA